MARPPLAIHWEQRGAGDPVVLLHGLGGDTGFWRLYIPGLAARHTVIAIDLRGSGLTPAGHDGYGIADLADDVADVLDDLDIPSTHVVGFALGGSVALSFAVRHAARLDRMVLVATSVDGTADLAAITAPTLVLLGSEDDVVTAAESADLVAAIRGSRFALVAGAGHRIDVDQPERFVAAILDFLDTETAPQPSPRDKDPS